MRQGSTFRRLLAAGAAVGAVLLMSGQALAAPRRNSIVAQDAVSITVTEVDPSTPAAEANASPLTFTLELTNTSDVSFDSLTIGAERGTPIGSQSALDEAMSDPQPPDNGLDILQPGQAPPSTPLAAGASTRIQVQTVSSTVDHDGLCICANEIYPIWFTASAVLDGLNTQVGSGHTYVPAFVNAPTPVQVSWVWPLLERPHRILTDNDFIDDDLARSVAPGGRLDHLLQVVEAVEPDVPLTLVVDPELLDELVVMTKGYSVTTNGTTTRGTGGPAAQQWLTRFEQVLDVPGLDLALTPYADPDVQALTDEGLTWASTMPSAMQSRVDGVLGGHHADTELAWPAGGVLSPRAATAIARTGVRSVLLGGAALRRSGTSQQSSAAASNAANSGPALVSTGAGDLRVFATPATLTPYLDAALTSGPDGTAHIAEAVAQVAIAAVADPSKAHPVLLLPPAGLDPDPATAAAAILATASTTWSRPVSALSALLEQPHARATLAHTSGNGLPAQTSSTARAVSNALPALSSLLDPNDAASLIAGLPDAVQRLGSASWATDRDRQQDASALVASQLDSLTGGVKLVVPSHGSYTLGSSDSPLPLTIENKSDKTVNVRIKVTAVGGVPGFRADDVGVQTIPPQSKLPLHIPVHVDRAGRIRVQAVLSAPAETASGSALVLGQPLILSVRSTALGVIGRAITYAAGGLLLLALVVRFWLRRRRPKAATRTSARTRSTVG